MVSGLTGKDGRTNKALLRSGDPDLIYPGEEIWIPDVVERTKWIRSVELEDRSFSKPQLEAMKKWIGYSKAR